MKQVAKFEKVSYKQFKNDIQDIYYGALSESNIRKAYEIVTLPKRATKDSAGYDFVTPVQIKLQPKQTIKIPTGIRCKIEPGWVLKCYPRSGLGFKYRLQLNNTVGIIDGDYFYSDNEGHIFIKIMNDTNEDKVIELKEGDRFCQGIFVEYGITYDDEADGFRNGGFGSTERMNVEKFVEKIANNDKNCF